MSGLCKAIKKDIVYILVYTYFNLRAEVSSYVLGVIWWILEPVLFVFGFMFAFSSGLRGGGLEFAIYLLTGILPFRLISSSAVMGAGSIERDRATLINSHQPMYLTVISGFIVNWTKFILVYSVYIMMAILLGKNTACLLLMPLFLVLLFVFSLGVNVFLSAVSPYFPDLRQIVGSMMFILMFASGIVYDMDDLHGRFGVLIQYNPIAHIIDLAKEIFIRGEPLDMSRVLAVLAVSLLLNVFGFSMIWIGKGRCLKYV